MKLQEPFSLSSKFYFARADISFLGWLQSNETFELTHLDAAITLLCNTTTRELPTNVGMLELLLLLENKSAATFRANVIIAAITLVGLNPLWWFQLIRLLSFKLSASDLIFYNNTGVRWTSSFFHVQFLYPYLTQLQTDGDFYLQGIEIPLLFGLYNVTSVGLARMWIKLHFAVLGDVFVVPSSPWSMNTVVGLWVAPLFPLMSSTVNGHLVTGFILLRCSSNPSEDRVGGERV